MKMKKKSRETVSREESRDRIRRRCKDRQKDRQNEREPAFSGCLTTVSLTREEWRKLWKEHRRYKLDIEWAKNTRLTESRECISRMCCKNRSFCKNYWGCLTLSWLRARPLNFRTKSLNPNRTLSSSREISSTKKPKNPSSFPEAVKSLSRLCCCHTCSLRYVPLNFPGMFSGLVCVKLQYCMEHAWGVF